MNGQAPDLFDLKSYRLNSKFSSLADLNAHYGGHGTLKIDLGCGYVKPPGYIGLDNLVGSAVQVKNDKNAPDILMDLNTRQLPFEDNSVERVRASHFFEHCNCDHIILESFRALKTGGIFELIVPYANSAEGMYPGHLLFFTEKWFELNVVFQKCFKIESISHKPSEYWDSLPAELKKILPFDLARIFLFNTCNEMTLIAKSRK